ncbi:hypothetical protein COLO4_02049 [Corchorus olitorius]|uniref:Uncharacterized protein n=1 Tax=Corchorus olitorius TaxID=93759 RepID=A0A1R3L1Q8_9ROSI|nr:hypothetical protein COLO4_02049 [Corchorus olitorius]
MVVQPLHGFDGAEHAQHAIVTSGVAHGIEVRAEQQRRCARLRRFIATADIADRILPARHSAPSPAPPLTAPHRRSSGYDSCVAPVVVPGSLQRRALSGAETDVIQHGLQRAQRQHHAIFARVVAHGADAPHFAVQRTERGANLNAEIVQHQFAYLVAVDALRDHHAKHVIHLVSEIAKGFQPHALNAFQQRITVQFVARDAVIQPFLQDQTGTFACAKQRRGGFGMVVEPLRSPVIHDHAEIEVVGVDHLVDAILMCVGTDALLHALTLADHRFHLRAQGDRRGTGRTAEAFLHAGRDRIQPPGIGFQRVAAQRCGGIGVQQHAVLATNRTELLQRLQHGG